MIPKDRFLTNTVDEQDEGDQDQWGTHNIGGLKNLSQSQDRTKQIAKGCGDCFKEVDDPMEDVTLDLHLLEEQENTKKKDKANYNLETKIPY